MHAPTCLNARVSAMLQVTEDCVRLRAEAGLPPAAAGSSGSLPVAVHAVAAAMGDSADSDGDSESLHCTRETVGVQRRVAAVLLGAVDFAVYSLEQYNNQAALASLNHY
jgi:hypothetical protein